MEESEDRKRSWRREWLSSISELADLELQKRTWLDTANSNPHWSYIEFVESYFDLGVDDGYARVLAADYVTPEEVAAIRDFHRALDQYTPPDGDTWINARVLKDESWSEVVSAAKQTRQRLFSLIEDPLEREFLRKDPAD